MYTQQQRACSGGEDDGLGGLKLASWKRPAATTTTTTTSDGGAGLKLTTWKRPGSSPEKKAEEKETPLAEKVCCFFLSCEVQICSNRFAVDTNNPI